jgi:hypothetical protein
MKGAYKNLSMVKVYDSYSSEKSNNIHEYEEDGAARL